MGATAGTGAWREDGVANRCRGDKRWFALPWWHSGARVVNGGAVGSNCCGWCTNVSTIAMVSLRRR